MQTTVSNREVRSNCQRKKMMNRDTKKTKQNKKKNQRSICMAQAGKIKKMILKE